jgi:hypothetical protein
MCLQLPALLLLPTLNPNPCCMCLQLPALQFLPTRWKVLPGLAAVQTLQTLTSAAALVAMVILDGVTPSPAATAAG